MLKVQNLTVGYGDITIVNDVTFFISYGEIVGIVGESGCGKSTLLKSIIALPETDAVVKGGSIHFAGSDILNLSHKELREIRGSRIAVVFQKPDAAFDPITRIKNQFYECMKYHNCGIRKKEAIEISGKLLKDLHFDNVKQILNSYPFELSGGMNQRVALAMAMLNQPELILADEPTSALDVTIQSQVIRTMIELRERFGTAVLIVTHNMKVVTQLVDTIGVMYAGKIIEWGEKPDVLNHPAHPYTKALIQAIPQMDGSLPQRIAGRPPSFTENIEGCSFYKRCPYADTRCKRYLPEPNFISEKHWCLCSKWERRGNT